MSFRDLSPLDRTTSGQLVNVDGRFGRDSVALLSDFSEEQRDRSAIIVQRCSDRELAASRFWMLAQNSA